MNRNIKLCPILLLPFLIMPAMIQGQDNHYWTQQYGARAALLGGSIIGQADDNSSIYYNPGFLGFLDSSTLNLNANIYSYERLSVKNGAGDNVDIKSRQPNIYPQFLSGTIKFTEKSPITWSYALFTRNHSNYYTRLRHEGFYNVVESSPENELYIGSFEYSNQIDEQWGGIGAGIKLNNHLAVGLSTFIGYRFQNYQFSYYTRMMAQGTEKEAYFASTNWYEDIYLQEFYILWKAGLSMDFGKLKGGLTITTPNLPLYGWTNVQRENSQYNLNRSLEGEIYDDILLMDRQEDLPTQYKFPWSFGAGISYQLSAKLDLMASCEYFAKVALYEMVKAEQKPFLYPDNSAFADYLKGIRFLSVYGVNNEVFNFSLGAEFKINDKLSWLSGFRTDHSHFKASERVDYDRPEVLFISAFDIDLYHISTGLAIHKPKSRITAGINYAFAREHNLQQIINFTDPKDYNFLVGNNAPVADVLINSYSLIIGYLHYF